MNPNLATMEAESGYWELGFNAKAQRRQDAKRSGFFFAPLHLGVFALNPFACVPIAAP
jgi:hypothetical protein